MVAFEKASGLNIQYGWGKPERIGEIVKLIIEAETHPLKRILDTAKYNFSKTEDLKDGDREINQSSRRCDGGTESGRMKRND